MVPDSSYKITPDYSDITPNAYTKTSAKVTQSGGFATTIPDVVTYLPIRLVTYKEITDYTQKEDKKPKNAMAWGGVFGKKGKKGRR
jgi:hypothetical protein